MSQHKFADQVDVSKQTIFVMEKGNYTKIIGQENDCSQKILKSNYYHTAKAYFKERNK